MYCELCSLLMLDSTVSRTGDGSFVVNDRQLHIQALDVAQWVIGVLQGEVSADLPTSAGEC